MGMCPCTLAGRRGDSGIGELVLGGRHSASVTGDGDILIRVGRRAAGGREDGSDGRGGWVRPGGWLRDERARPTTITIGLCVFRVYGTSLTMRDVYKYTCGGVYTHFNVYRFFFF